MNLTYYTFNIKKNIRILGYKSLVCIKGAVLEIPSSKYIYLIGS